jgi:hypothetical protein
MKKFKFPLEKLQTWRDMQFQIEQDKLRRLLSEQTSLLRLRAELDTDRRRASSIVGSARIDSGELQAADRFRSFAARREAELDSGLDKVAARIGQQRQSLLAARKNVEVLNQLRRNQLSKWREELDKEHENLVAELVVARWKSHRSNL